MAMMAKVLLHLLHPQLPGAAVFSRHTPPSIGSCIGQPKRANLVDVC